uniref:Transmembrane protein 43 n=1 Tax=Salarias fasciatus TaxID=181472 RepID=A0A672FIN3_SALFA
MVLIYSSVPAACLSQFSGGYPDQHKRVTSKSNPGFLERLSETAGGMAVGVGLFFLSIYVLFTNEGRALQTASSLDEGLSQVVSLGPYLRMDLENNNHLVHLTAPLHTSQPLHDPNYRVELQAAKLRRQVEMYQWVEYRESKDYQENGETKTETTYTYNTEWKSELINSRNFDKEIGHQNPSAMAVESVTVVAPEVRVGPFILSKGVYLTESTEADEHQHRIFTLIYFNLLSVGDVRVRFSYAGLSGDNSLLGPAKTVSIVAMQRGEQLLPFKTKSGDTLEIIYLEELSAEEVFAREQQYNSMKTWGLRAAGWALMCLSIQLAMRIIYTLVDWVPVLRDLVSVGLKIFAVCVSCSLSLLVIGVGWLFYRPLVALALGALALVPVFLARSGLPSKKTQ